MKCKYFWGNNNRCINNKCYREKKKPVVAKKPASECDGCPYNKGERILFPLYEENPWKVEAVMKFRFRITIKEEDRR